VTQAGEFGKMCPHCGSTGSRKLGECDVCHRAVCEHGGSIQFTAGKHKPLHRECLKTDDSGFKMIKFVR
jgi:hypothetical protein